MEAKIVVQALRINTLSKLTFSDGLSFDGLLKDVFPGVEMKDIEYEDLAKNIRAVCEETHLVINEKQVAETMCSCSADTSRVLNTCCGCCVNVC